EPSVVAEQGAQSPGQRADPLAHHHFGEDALGEMEGAVRHATTQAAGAEAPPLAGKPYEALVPAARAREAQKAMLEHAAAQVLVERGGDELRRTPCLFRWLSERRPVPCDDLVEGRVLRLTSLGATRERAVGVMPTRGLGRRHAGRPGQVRAESRAQ